MHPRLAVVEQWASGQRDVVSSIQSWHLGLPRPWPQRLVASGRWQRLVRGVFWTRPWGVPAPEQVLIAARLFAGGGLTPLGVAVGMSAVRMHGIVEAGWPWRPELALPLRYQRRQPRCVGYSWARLAPADLVDCGGIPCLTALASLRDVAREGAFADVLVVVDAALRSGLVAASALPADGGGLVFDGRRALGLGDGRSESVFESRLRAEILAAGLPPPALQHEVRTPSGRLLGRVDLAWPGSGVVLEADGAATHSGPVALRDDLRRQNELVEAGFTVLRFTWADLGRIAPVVRRALGGVLSRTRSAGASGL